MLALPSKPRIFIYQDAVSMHNSFEGLSAMVQQHFPESATSGAFFVFINRQRNRMKVLYWDNDGLALWYKRLEQGCFPRTEDNQITIDRREFLMLLEGIVPKRKHKRFSSP